MTISTRIQPGSSQAIAIGFAIVFPSVVTLMYFVLLAGSSPGLQQAAYAIGKTIQFGFPLAWVALVLREPIRWSPPTSRGLPLGLAFGLAASVAMLGLYVLWLKPSGLLEGAEASIREKVSSLGLGTRGRYAAVAVFYALFHSLMEEYYWRWFVFRKLHEQRPLITAVVISSLGFMAHHVILMATFFGWTSPMTYVFSLAVAVGGAMWAWLYARCGTLYAPWLSHLLVDAAIFLIGYDMVRDQLT